MAAVSKVLEAQLPQRTTQDMLRTHQLLPLAMGFASSNHIRRENQTGHTMYVSKKYILATHPAIAVEDNETGTVSDLFPWLGLPESEAFSFPHDALSLNQLALGGHSDNFPLLVSGPILASIAAQLNAARAERAKHRKERNVQALLSEERKAFQTASMDNELSVTAIVGITTSAGIRNAIPAVIRLASDLIGTTMEHALAMSTLSNGLQLLAMVSMHGRLGAATLTVTTERRERIADINDPQQQEKNKRGPSLSEVFLGAPIVKPKATNHSPLTVAQSVVEEQRCQIKMAVTRHPFWYRDWWNVPLLALLQGAILQSPQLFEGYIGRRTAKYLGQTMPAARQRQAPVKTNSEIESKFNWGSQLLEEWQTVSGALTKLFRSAATFERFIKLLCAIVITNELRLLNSEDYDDPVDDSLGGSNSSAGTANKREEDVLRKQLDYSLQPATTADWEGLRVLTELLADINFDGEKVQSSTEDGMASLLKVLRTAPCGSVTCDTGVMPFHGAIVVARGICMLPTELGHMAIDIIESAIDQRLAEVHIFPVEGSVLGMGMKREATWQPGDGRAVDEEVVFINVCECTLAPPSNAGSMKENAVSQPIATRSPLAPNPLIQGSIYNHRRLAKHQTSQKVEQTHAAPSEPMKQEICSLRAFWGNLCYDHSLALGGVALGMSDVAEACSKVISSFTGQDSKATTMVGANKSTSNRAGHGLGALSCQHALVDKLYTSNPEQGTFVEGANEKDPLHAQMRLVVDHSYARLRYLDNTISSMAQSPHSALLLWPLGLTRDQLEELSVKSSKGSPRSSSSARLQQHFAGVPSSKHYTNIQTMKSKTSQPTTAAEFKLRQQKEVVDVEFSKFLQEMTQRYIDSLDSVYSTPMRAAIAASKRDTKTLTDHISLVKCFLHLVPPLTPSLAAAAKFAQTNGSIFKSEHFYKSSFFKGIEISLGAKLLNLADATASSDDQDAVPGNRSLTVLSFEEFSKKHFVLVMTNKRLIAFMREKSVAKGLKDDDFITLLCEALRLTHRSYRVDPYLAQIVLSPTAVEQLEGLHKEHATLHHDRQSRLSLAEEQMLRRQGSRLDRDRPWSSSSSLKSEVNKEPESQSSRFPLGRKTSSASLKYSAGSIKSKMSPTSEFEIPTTPKSPKGAMMIQRSRAHLGGRSTSVMNVPAEDEISAPESNNRHVVHSEDASPLEFSQNNLNIISNDPSPLLVLSASFAMPPVESRDGTPSNSRSGSGSEKHNDGPAPQTLDVKPTQVSASTMTIGTLWRAGNSLPSSPTKPTAVSEDKSLVKSENLIPPWRRQESFSDLVNLTTSARQRIEKQRCLRKEGPAISGVSVPLSCGRGDQSLSGPDGWNQLVPSPMRNRVISLSLAVVPRQQITSSGSTPRRGLGGKDSAKSPSHSQRSGSTCRECLVPDHFKNRFVSGNKPTSTPVRHSQEPKIHHKSSVLEGDASSKVKLTIADFQSLISSTLGPLSQKTDTTTLKPEPAHAMKDAQKKHNGNLSTFGLGATVGRVPTSANSLKSQSPTRKLYSV